MGLAGASKKQRIQDDPRNLRWAQDTSAPGFRLLASMGWNPESNPSLGNAESQAAIIANGGSVFSARKIAAIPLAKDDNLGIGMKRGTGAHVVGSLRAIGVSPLSGANAVGPGSGSSSAQPGFVSAGSGTATPQDGVTGGGSGGGEFGNLLARLNKLKEMNGGVISQSSASPSPAPESSKKKRKRSGSTSSSSSSSSSDSDSDSSSDEEVATPVASTSQTASPAPPSAAALALLKNPRMAARSKHLRAKRLATASNASAMAEILGLAPSATTSPASSLAGSPAPPSMRPALAVNGPRTDGWPEVPARRSSAIVSVTTTTTTTSTTEATTVGGEDDKARRKAEKAARKAEKEARKAAKAAKKAAKASSNETDDATTRKARSPSPEFKVHSAAHDPFKVTADVPTATQPTGLASVFGSMFARASTGGMGATFVPPTFAPASSSTSLAATFDPKAEEESKAAAVAEEEEAASSSKVKKEKKSKSKKGESSSGEGKSKKDKKRKAVDDASVAEAEGATEGESKEERKARKEAKRAKKEAKAAAKKAGKE
ncbi:hypothetical protein JCM10908_001730 [Rhodotorula pacifica]|uniref:uncharacterized protein n=1 Tax=Rhodotorula pacifica TaxID=1495444 RepID=UPI003181E340